MMVDSGGGMELKRLAVRAMPTVDYDEYRDGTRNITAVSEGRSGTPRRPSSTRGVDTLRAKRAAPERNSTSNWKPAVQDNGRTEPPDQLSMLRPCDCSSDRRLCPTLITTQRDVCALFRESQDARDAPSGTGARHSSSATGPTCSTAFRSATRKNTLGKINWHDIRHVDETGTGIRTSPSLTCCITNRIR